MLIVGLALFFAIGLLLICLKIILAFQIKPPERSNSPELSIVEDNSYDAESALLMIELLCQNGDYFACLDIGKIYKTGRYKGAEFAPNADKSRWGYQKACNIETVEQKKENKKEGCTALRNIGVPLEE